MRESSNGPGVWTKKISNVRVRAPWSKIPVIPQSLGDRITLCVLLPRIPISLLSDGFMPLLPPPQLRPSEERMIPQRIILRDGDNPSIPAQSPL